MWRCDDETQNENNMPTTREMCKTTCQGAVERPLQDNTHQESTQSTATQKSVRENHKLFEGIFDGWCDGINQ